MDFDHHTDSGDVQQAGYPPYQVKIQARFSEEILLNKSWQYSSPRSTDRVGRHSGYGMFQRFIISEITTSYPRSSRFFVYPNPFFNPSYTAKIIAELGADLTTVIPQPLYKPLIPCCFHKAFPLSQKVSLFVTPRPVMSTGLTSSVCIRDLIVSAGKNMKLYDTPAVAPARSCCHSDRVCV